VAGAVGGVAGRHRSIRLPHVQFPYARIGFEVSTADPEEWLRSADMPPPGERGIGVLRRELDELAWYPTTLWGGPVGTTWDGLVDVTPWEIRLRSWLRRRRERLRRQAGAR